MPRLQAFGLSAALGPEFLSLYSPAHFYCLTIFFKESVFSKITTKMIMTSMTDWKARGHGGSDDGNLNHIPTAIGITVCPVQRHDTTARANFIRNSSLPGQANAQSSCLYNHGADSSYFEFYALTHALYHCIVSPFMRKFGKK